MILLSDSYSRGSLKFFGWFRVSLEYIYVYEDFVVFSLPDIVMDGSKSFSFQCFSLTRVVSSTAPGSVEKNFGSRVAAHAPTKYQSNSTTGRGARASYQTMLPEISARRSLLEPSFRYLSPGREREKCRPLDHLGHIPFVHSARKLHGSNFLYIQQHSRYFLHVVRSSTSYARAYLTIAHAFLQKHSYLWFRAIISLVFFHMVRAGAYWHKIHDIHAFAFVVQTK